MSQKKKWRKTKKLLCSQPRKSKKEKKKKKRQRAKESTQNKRAGWSLCASEHEHFCQSRYSESPPNFLPILGRKHFGRIGEKILRPHHFFFPSPPSNQKPTKNVFSSIFSYFLSILLKIHPTKYTNEPQKYCPNMLGITYQRITHNYFGKEQREKVKDNRRKEPWSTKKAKVEEKKICNPLVVQ